MSLIAIDERSFAELYDLVVDIKAQLGAKPNDKWIDGSEAMQVLRIKSKTTLAKLRAEGKIRYSQPEPKIILYDRGSIEAYLEKSARNVF